MGAIGEHVNIIIVYVFGRKYILKKMGYLKNHFQGLNFKAKQPHEHRHRITYRDVQNIAFHTSRHKSTIALQRNNDLITFL